MKIQLNAKKIKVLQVINDVGLGGGESYILTLAEHMTKLGFDFISTCRPDGSFEKALKKRYLDRFPVRLSRKNILHKARLIARFTKGENIRIVHAHGPTGALAARIACMMPGGVPPLTTYHMAITSITDIPFFKKKLFALFDRCTSTVDKLIIAVSESVRDQMVKQAFFRRDRIQILYSGVDIDRFKGVIRGKLRKELGFEDDTPVIGSVARLSDEKGLGFLIQSMPNVLMKMPKSVLLVAGDGPLREKLSSMIDRLGIMTNVILLGQRNDIPQLMADIDVLVMPSVTEGFPLTLLEGMSAGLPVIASRVGGIPEVITDGREGMLIPPKNPNAIAKAIMKVLNDRNLAKKLGKEARKRVEKEFSVDKMVSETEKLYQSLYREKYCHHENIDAN